MKSLRYIFVILFAMTGCWIHLSAGGDTGDACLTKEDCHLDYCNCVAAEGEFWTASYCYEGSCADPQATCEWMCKEYENSTPATWAVYDGGN